MKYVYNRHRGQAHQDVLGPRPVVSSMRIALSVFIVAPSNLTFSEPLAARCNPTPRQVFPERATAIRRRREQTNARNGNLADRSAGHAPPRLCFYNNETNSSASYAYLRGVKDKQATQPGVFGLVFLLL